MKIIEKNFDESILPTPNKPAQSNEGYLEICIEQESVAKDFRGILDGTNVVLHALYLLT